jgi:DtxR family Mn-dependent transcriptional regulator
VYGENTEMYLKTLVELAADREVVPVTALAERLGISTVSASEKVRRLQDQGFVEHLPYKGVQLTRAGLKRANTVLRRHRLWERFLVDRLGIEWEHAHDAACRLEHATSREISEHLADFLDQPETCPHGNPIPAAEEAAVRPYGMRLSELDLPASVVIMSIFPENTELLAWIIASGLMPGTRCEVLSLSAAGQPVEFEINGERVQVPEKAAAQLYVRPYGEVHAE